MEDSDSVACLPPGWTVKVNVRKNGKKDKYYFPPSSDLKFNSIVSVFRYLNNAKNKAIIRSVDMENDQQIPRRASKRLAGIKADQLLELKPTRACRDAAKQSGDDKAGINADRFTNSFSNDQTKQLNTVEAKETMITFKSTENTMDNNATDKECVKVIENKDDIDVKLDYTDEFPLKEILTDPCIAFAVQTLTGNTFEPFKDAQTSASTEELGKKINVTNNDPKKFAFAEKHAAVAEIDNADKNTGPCSEKEHDISKMALSSVNLCKSHYNYSQIFGKESRSVC
ncbi:unnamed protein product [Lathyrus oleraceus]|uniref:uncharacterized protein LOC127129542 n=1 Tax=Pisum sativum TaxID=3888 RepID=UPI0021CE3D79|nr:uncharacterized protein LOC127129542 [Pisum sativum]